jgi:hypothetical protein
MHQKGEKKPQQQQQQMYTGLRQGIRLRRLDLQQALRGRKKGSERTEPGSERASKAPFRSDHMRSTEKKGGKVLLPPQKNQMPKIAKMAKYPAPKKTGKKSSLVLTSAFFFREFFFVAKMAVIQK